MHGIPINDVGPTQEIFTKLKASDTVGAYSRPAQAHKLL